MNGRVIKEMQVDAEGECRLRCVDEEQCRSYNFGLKKHKAGNFLCQLNGSDKSVGFGNFTKDDNFKYRGMEVIKVKGGGGGVLPIMASTGRLSPKVPFSGCRYMKG